MCHVIGPQLLNQMEGAGPPPADADKIEGLPKVKTSQLLHLPAPTSHTFTPPFEVRLIHSELVVT